MLILSVIGILGIIIGAMLFIVFTIGTIMSMVEEDSRGTKGSAGLALNGLVYLVFTLSGWTWMWGYDGLQKDRAVLNGDAYYTSAGNIVTSNANLGKYLGIPHKENK